jgi:ketosteroid isomerase-like protein
MITKEFAQHFAEDWVTSWNAHDLDRVLSHYTEDFEMSTPFIVSLMNEPTGTLKGKDKVGAYWSNALQKYPDLKFEMHDVLSGVDSVVIYYTSILGKKAVEFFMFNADGKVYKAIAHYD